MNESISLFLCHHKVNFYVHTNTELIGSYRYKKSQRFQKIRNITKDSTLKNNTVIKFEIKMTYKCVKFLSFFLSSSFFFLVKSNITQALERTHTGNYKIFRTKW